MNLRRAEPRDLAVVLDLRREAAAWLSPTTDQWRQDSANISPEEILRAIEAGETLMVDDLATITVNRRTSPQLWSLQEQQEAMFVHRLIVSRAAAGRGVGAALLDYASELTELADLPWVRLDCWTTNAHLHDYYLSQGFSHVRTVPASVTPSGALFQRCSSLRGAHLRPPPAPGYDWTRASH